MYFSLISINFLAHVDIYCVVHYGPVSLLNRINQIVPCPHKLFPPFNWIYNLRLRMYLLHIHHDLNSRWLGVPFVLNCVFIWMVPARIYLLIIALPWSKSSLLYYCKDVVTSINWNININQWPTNLGVSKVSLTYLIHLMHASSLMRNKQI